MFRTFGEWKNPSRRSCFLSIHPCVCVCACAECVLVCVHFFCTAPAGYVCSENQRKSNNRRTISMKTEAKNKDVPPFVFLCQVLRIFYCICISAVHLIRRLASPINLTYPRERVHMFPFFFSFPVYLHTGAPSGDKCFPHAG